MSQTYIAHINEKTKEIQTVKEHSENTANLCRSFAIPPMKDFMYLTGLMHDIGKLQSSFQKKICGDANIRVEHSTCGAIAAKNQFPNAAGLMMEYCIAGHHSGLPDAGSKNDTKDMATLCGRMKRRFEDYSTYKTELVIPEMDPQPFMSFLLQDCGNDLSLFVDKFAFLTRYCFSCLVDADSLDTAEFCGEAWDRQMSADFGACLKRINERLDSFVCHTALQQSRNLLQQQAFQKVDRDGEIYLMNMPTGSGKTLASMKFALERALRKRKKRIIYIIPYNSIIDQTAEEFEKLFQGCGEILRHQSTFSYENEEEGMDEDYARTAKKAAENWDAPLIITTMVQFFQSLYDHKRRKLRKLHNMADSILVFDEAHLMPVDYLQPCLRGISYLTKYLNSEAVFLTATMPNFPKLLGRYALKDSRIISLIEDTSVFSEFQKCKYDYVGKISEEMLIERACISPSSLIIVNSRRKARSLYRKCRGQKYHLSTYMTAYDRKRVLSDIRKELRCLEEEFPDYKNVPEERRITIVSTSLIEAGVDLDVYTVFRELNGLDNILQAGGRCNREGKRKEAEVILFELEGDQKCTDERINMVRGILKKYPDISCLECIAEYYERLFAFKSQAIQENRITKNCHNIDSIPFKTYGENFKLIDSHTVSIVVPRDEKSRKLVAELPYAGAGLARKLQLYTCSVYEQELGELVRQHVAEDFGTGIYCLTNPDYYDTEIGLIFEARDYILD